MGREGSNEAPFPAATELCFGAADVLAMPPPTPLFMTGHAARSIESAAPKFKFISLVEKMVGLKTKDVFTALEVAGSVALA